MQSNAALTSHFVVAPQGGAVFVAGSRGISAAASTFQLSTAAGKPGGGALATPGLLSVTGCSFSAAYAPAGDGGALWTGANASVATSTFAGGSTSGRGGAVFAALSASVSASAFTDLTSGEEARRWCRTSLDLLRALSLRHFCVRE